jgi:hypothetical protein
VLPLYPVPVQVRDSRARLGNDTTTGPCPDIPWAWGNAHTCLTYTATASHHELGRCWAGARLSTSALQLMSVGLPPHRVTGFQFARTMSYKIYENNNACCGAEFLQSTAWLRPFGATVPCHALRCAPTQAQLVSPCSLEATNVKWRVTAQSRVLHNVHSMAAVSGSRLPSPARRGKLVAAPREATPQRAAASMAVGCGTAFAFCSTCSRRCAAAAAARGHLCISGAAALCGPCQLAALHVTAVQADLPPDARHRAQQELDGLLGQHQAAKQAELERKLAVRYHKACATALDRT